MILAPKYFPKGCNSKTVSGALQRPFSSTTYGKQYSTSKPKTWPLANSQTRHRTVVLSWKPSVSRNKGPKLESLGFLCY